MRENDARLPLRQLFAACLLAVLTVPATTTHTHAAFYKCVAEDGSTTYNDAPCAADESTHMLSKSARELSVLDCRIATNFAFDAVARMRQNDKAEDVFNAYGGAANVSTGARMLINYVFSFEKKTLVSAQRIVDLTVKRCQAGLLSETLDQCDTFPQAFIDRFGGCSKARQSKHTVLIQSQGSDQLSGKLTDNGNTDTPPTLNAANPAPDAANTDDRSPDDRSNQSLRRNDR